MRLGRRDFGIGLATGLFAEGGAGLVVRGLRLEHEALFVWPRVAAAPVRLVVLLHGLGETHDESLGARAWVDRYGLLDAVARVEAERGAGHRGLAFVTPAVPRLKPRDVDGYTRWLAEALVPAARAEIGAPLDPAPPHIAGCSYGGWVSLEAVLRAPARFDAWAGVQTAIGRAQATSYAARLANVARRPLLVESSSLDPFRDANVALAENLRERGLACDLRVLPGPHDQPWLRRSGTPEVIGWLGAV